MTPSLKDLFVTKTKMKIYKIPMLLQIVRSPESILCLIIIIN